VKERELRDALMDKAVTFCPEAKELNIDGPSPMPACLKWEGVRFLIVFATGLAEFMADYSIKATASSLEFYARMKHPVTGEVPTRSKLPVTFLVARRGILHMTLSLDQGATKLTVEPGSLLGLPVDSAVEAGNRFFDDLAMHVAEPGAAHADTIGKYVLSWWEGCNEWQSQGRGVDFKNSKLWMIYMVLAGSKYGSAVPRKNLGQVLLGSLCVTPQEYTSFEWTTAEPDGAAVVCCTVVAAEGMCSEIDRHSILRNQIATSTQEAFITNPQNRKIGETMSKSATHFVSMRVSKELGLRRAAVQPILKLFSPCHCAHTAGKWDVLAQDWQRNLDVTYSCTGASEGRIIWRPSTMMSAADESLGSNAPQPKSNRLSSCLVPCCGTCLPTKHQCPRRSSTATRDHSGALPCRPSESTQQGRCKIENVGEYIEPFQLQRQFFSFKLWPLLILMVAVLLVIITKR